MLQLGLRGKQIAVLTLVAGVVALATSIMNVAAVTQVQVRHTLEQATLFAQGLYHQARSVLAVSATDELSAALSRDEGVVAYAEAAIGYSPVTMYLAIVDDNEVALFHTEPSRVGAAAGPTESLAEFSERNIAAQIWALATDHRSLVVDLPFTIDGSQPFGSVRVAVSTLLLRSELRRVLARNATSSGLIILLAFVASFLLANVVLAPFERLRERLREVPSGSDSPLDLRTEADIDRLAEFFDSLGNRLRTGKITDARDDWLPTMFEGIKDAVVAVDPDRCVLAANAPAVRLLGDEGVQPQGRTIESLIGTDHPLTAVVEEVLADQHNISGRSVMLADREGSQCEYLISAHALGGCSRPAGVIVIARDVQTLSRLASQLSYSQKLTALGRLTAGVAHEIRNPLNTLRLQVALLEDASPLDDAKAAPRLEALNSEIDRLGRVVEAFAEFTRPDEVRVQTLDVGPAIRRTVERIRPQADASQVEIEVDVRQPLPELLADRELLEQAFFNLAKNACEAMADGGRLTIGAHAAPETNEVVVELEDTGHGIPEDQLPRIFDLHYTTKQAGSGVGLSLVFRIVQLHGGDISVQSTPGRGTRFELRFPESSL